jgi:hypothetical protein
MKACVLPDKSKISQQLTSDVFTEENIAIVAVIIKGDEQGGGGL